VSRRQVAQAEESARLSRERFSAGALLSAELIGVESRLAEARVQLAQTIAAERVALAELRLALGLSVLANE
jgi:outer membrane protein TolC